MSTKSKYYDGIYELRKKSVRADSSTTTLDLSDATFYDILLEADTAIVLNNPLKGVYTITIDQTAAFTVTWPANVLFPNGIYTGIGSVEDKKSDVFTLIYDGTNFYASQESNLVLPYLLDNFQGAAAAYSLRNLTSDNIGQPVVRVRRSSDNAETNFIESEITDGTLEDWVNTEHQSYTSNFASGADGWLGVFGVATGNIDSVSGVDDALRFVIDTNTNVHGLSKSSLFLVGYEYTISFDYYIPSSNVNIDGISAAFGGAFFGGIQNTLDSWTSVELIGNIASNSAFNIRAFDGGGQSFTGNGTDVFYIKNVVITQTTSDGHVTTWHDQAPKEIYKSDFTSGNEDLVETLGTATDGVSIGGENNVYEFTADGTVGVHRARIENLIPIDGRRYRLKLKYYLPSTNTVINRLNFLNAGTSNLFETTTDQWVEIDVGGTASVSNDFDINMYSDAVNVIAAAGDKFYLKDIEIYGFNDLKQTTAANQPKIIDAGALVTENGKPAVDFDGTNDFLSLLTIDFGNNIDFYLYYIQSGHSGSNYSDFSSAIDSYRDIGTRSNNTVFVYDLVSGETFTFINNLGVIPSYHLTNVVRQSNHDLYSYVNGQFCDNPISYPFDVSITNIGRSFPNALYSNSAFHEILIYNVDKSVERIGIESNINSHYNIY